MDPRSVDAEQEPDIRQKPAELPHVLIVDDDDRIRELVSRYLKEHDFIVCAAENAAAAAEMMDIFVFDALIVDVMMPGQNGLEFTKALRSGGSDVPVILLTALGEARDRVAGLETGADDYLPKPFEPRELVLRLRAILRRRPQSVAAADVGPFRIGRLAYDPDHNELTSAAGGATAPVRLTTVEGNLLRALAARAGEVVSREDLARMCDLDAGERTIDVQVTRLRRKIEDEPKAPRILQTIRGKGYLLRTDRE